MLIYYLQLVLLPLLKLMWIHSYSHSGPESYNSLNTVPETVAQFFKTLKRVWKELTYLPTYLPVVCSKTGKLQLCKYNEKQYKENQCTDEGKLYAVVWRTLACWGRGVFTVCVSYLAGSSGGTFIWVTRSTWARCSLVTIKELLQSV